MKLSSALFGFCSLVLTAALGAAEARIPIGNLGEGRGYSFGRGDVAGHIQNGATPSGTPNATLMFYKFDNAGSRDNSFMRLHFDAQVPGVPSAVAVAYENPEDDTIPVGIFLTDTSGEVYLARGQAAPGRGEMTMAIPGHPAWRSGDGNGRIDYPLFFNFLMLEQPPEQRTGSLYITGVEFLTQVDADSALGGAVAVDEYHFGVNRIPLEIRFTPYADDIAAAYRCTLTLTDRYTGEDVQQLDLPLALPLADADAVRELVLDLPYGSYSCTLEIVNPATGVTVSRYNAPLQVMVEGCDVYASDAERLYEYHYGPLGGCHDAMTPEDSEKFGRRWFRFEVPNWENVEVEPGIYRTGVLGEAALPWIERNVRPNTLQTLYHYPAFRNPADLPDFAGGYGRYMQAFAEAVKGLIDTHELGNEDNGGTKFLYTEVARHGAAGVRSRQPLAFVGNSGTAHIDYNWLKYQIERGLFDTLDALLVHPYTNNSTCSEAASLEHHDSLAALDRLHELLFAAGGMKELWHTEFGWPNGDFAAEQARTKLYVRGLIIGDAADLKVQTIYNWDRDYNTVHYPAGVALHQFARRRQAARFVGLLTDRESGFYTAVYDHFGQPFAIQWTVKEGAFAPTVTGVYSDMFGNPVAAGEVKITQEPTYVDGIDPGVVEAAARANAEKLAARFEQFRRENPRPGFDRFAGIDPVDMTRLRAMLLSWLNDRTQPISRLDQALFDSALRWYLATARYFPAGNPEEPFDPAPFIAQVERENQELLDLYSVRYLLRTADRIRLQAEMSSTEWSRDACLAELALLRRACEVFLQYGERIQYAVFTGLYMEVNGELGEKLFFVPTVPTTVKFVTSNYSGADQTVTVRPFLPEGWTGEAATVTVPAGGEVRGELVITAASGADAKAISIATEIAGKPARITTFNNLEYQPAISVAVPLLTRRPGQLPLTFDNKEAEAVSGTVKFTPAGIGGAPLALVGIELPAGGSVTRTVELTPEAAQRLAQAGYVFDARFLLDDGRVFDVRGLDADFAVATRRDPAGKIDGDLSDWSNGLPLKINKEEYTYGSYGNSWSPDDLSAVTWLGWDEEKFYFAADVTDQVYNQTSSNDGVWAQDSIQVLLTADPDETDDSRIQDLWFALTPIGARVWHDQRRGHIDNCELYIHYENGRFIYEFAVPWSELGPDFERIPETGRFGYAIAVNDDDVLVPRRFLERFKGSVVHGRDLDCFAEVVLERETVAASPSAAEKVRFFDDFEAYSAGELPAGYAHVHNHVPHDLTLVVDGAGEGGGKALRMVNDIGVKDHHFCTLTGEVRVEPGRRYRADFRLKGRDCARASLGLCSDLWGNQDFNYLKLPAEIPDWTTFSLEFAGPATGRVNLILRNVDAVGELLVDEVKVVEL